MNRSGRALFEYSALPHSAVGGSLRARVAEI